MARRIMHLAQVGNLVTTFPDSQHAHDDDLETLENRPADVAGSPIGLMEYIADCEPETGDPTMLAIGIATPFRNYAAGSNISLGLRWWPEQPTIYSDYDIPTPHTPAALPRFSLQGRLEPISKSDLKQAKIAACFLKKHPDSILWQPGNDIHTSQYVRFVVEHFYWFGGFGDRARIGWIPVEEWRNVTMEEVEAMRLPGEKKKSGWRQWL